MNTELRALLFDVDGTLADTEEIHRQAFNAAFAEAGLDWEWSADLYHELLAVTGGKERIRYYLDRERPGFELPPDSAAFIAGLHQRKTAYYIERLTTGQVPLRPGVERLIREAHRHGLRLAVVTTTTDNCVSMAWRTVLASTVLPLKGCCSLCSGPAKRRPRPAAGMTMVGRNLIVSCG